MKLKSKFNTGKWLVVGGLLLWMGVSSAAAARVVPLTGAEKEWLTFLREEEKVARDVYLFLNDLWGAQVFANIAVSEQRHMDSVKSLLVKYSLPDPAAGKAEGEFTNPDLQAMYDQLIQQGGISLVDALEVGVLIEETDIEDLNAAMAATMRRDITNVYSNLLQGSLNHLQAFLKNLAAQGVVYSP